MGVVIRYKHRVEQRFREDERRSKNKKKRKEKKTREAGSEAKTVSNNGRNIE